MIPLKALSPTVLTLAAFVVAAPVSAHAQQERTLGAPDATFPEPFSLVGAGTVRELSDGRLIVADPRDKLLQVIDLGKGSSVAIGREGSGPAEFGMPMRLFDAPGDTTLMYDPVNSRYLVIAGATPVNTFRMDAGAAAGPGGMRVGLSIANATDAKGRLYFQAPGITYGPEGRPQPADSAAIIRYDRGTQRMDTLAWVKLPANNVQTSGNARNARFTIGAANPLTPRDAWTVFPDGRVAIVRAADYHVDWVSPAGRMTSSPAIKYSPVRMTRADIEEEEALRDRARQSSVRMSMTNVNGQVSRSASIGPEPNAAPLEPLDNWPEVKPPFRPGAGTVWARPNGELWVQRTEKAGTKGTLYDVIDAKGAVTHRVRVPEGWRVVGMGDGTVYTTKLDEDDLAYLQRHRLP